MDTKSTLIEARKLIENPEKWVRGGARAGDSSGCHCCQTAISKITGMSASRPILIEFARHIGGNELNYLGRIWTWNDAPERTHAEVLATFDKAIAVA